MYTILNVLLEMLRLISDLGQQCAVGPTPEAN